MSLLARCPHIERTIAAAFELQSDARPCGLLVASFFAKRGLDGKPHGKQADLDRWLFEQDDDKRGPKDAWRLSSWTQIDDEIARRVWAKESWVLAPLEHVTKRYRDRGWLARALMDAFDHGEEIATSLRYGALELESESRALLVGKRGENLLERIDQIEQRLGGVTPHGLLEEGFGTFFAATLFIAEQTYVAHRLAGSSHREAWSSTIDRLESPHPITGTDKIGRWLVAKLASSTRNHDKRARDLKKRDPHTVARSVLDALAVGAANHWPWSFNGAPFPSLEDEVIAGVVSQVLTIVARRRRRIGCDALTEGYNRFTRSPSAYEDAAKIVLEVSSVRGGMLTSFDHARLLAHTTLKRSSPLDRRRIAGAFAVKESELDQILAAARDKKAVFLDWLGGAVDDFVFTQKDGAR
jgi:hypothetical protein